MRRCIILGAGDYYKEEIKIAQGDFVIAADGGYNVAVKNKITPDLFVGDFDSCNIQVDAKEKLVLPVVKNDTDTLAAIRAGLERGFAEFHIYGGTGGRIDHTLSNIQSLIFLSKNGAIGFLHANGQVVTSITDSSLEIAPMESGYVSVFSDATATGVFESGMKYSLEDGELTSDFPIGTSNELCGNTARISVKKGTLIITLPEEAEVNYG